MSNPTEAFLNEGVASYALTLRALQDFEELLGKLCTDAIATACDGVFDVAPAQWKAWRTGGRPWVSAWTVLREGDPSVQLWAGVQWNLDGVRSEAAVTVNIYPRNRALEEHLAAIPTARVLPTGGLVGKVDKTVGVQGTLQPLLAAFLREFTELESRAPGSPASTQ